MIRLLHTYVLVATLHYHANAEGISYSPREWWRIWSLAWATAGEGTARA